MNNETKQTLTFETARVGKKIKFKDDVDVLQIIHTEEDEGGLRIVAVYNQDSPNEGHEEEIWENDFHKLEVIK